MVGEIEGYLWMPRRSADATREERRRRRRRLGVRKRKWCCVFYFYGGCYGTVMSSAKKNYDVIFLLERII